MRFIIIFISLSFNALTPQKHVNLDQPHFTAEESDVANSSRITQYSLSLLGARINALNVLIYFLFTIIL